MKNLKILALALISIGIVGCDNQHNEDYMQSLSTGKVYSIHDGPGDTYFIHELNVTKINNKINNLKNIQ